MTNAIVIYMDLICIIYNNVEKGKRELKYPVKYYNIIVCLLK